MEAHLCARALSALFAVYFAVSLGPSAIFNKDTSKARTQKEKRVKPCVQCKDATVMITLVGMR